MTDTSNRVFYVPGSHLTIDAVNPETGRGLYGGRTLEEIRQEHPRAEIGDAEAVFRAQEDACRSPVRETTEEAFMDALEVLPPVGWVMGRNQSFKISERLFGSITSIYARVDGRFFKLEDSISTPHGFIVDRCRRFMASDDA